jgi:hypothetical protein
VSISSSKSTSWSCTTLFVEVLLARCSTAAEPPNASNPGRANSHAGILSRSLPEWIPTLKRETMSKSPAMVVPIAMKG